MTASSKRFFFFLAIAFGALLLLCALNYWTSARAIDTLLRRELTAGSNATALDMSTVAMAAHDAAISNLRRALLLNLLATSGIAVAFSLASARAWRRRSRSLERVTAGAVAIAGGNLDQSLATSSDEMRVFTDSFNVVSQRLREKLEREAESRQFDAFMRVSAMLTHDLKNAIHGLSLLVRNMEEFHDREEFRAEAMRSLKDETVKLQRIVNQLSDPMNTMSGEHKRPQPTDLVPLIQRVLKSVTGSSDQSHQIETRFPESLIAVVDVERLEKVIENLVLNALEAMARQPGTLTLAGGDAGDYRIFFSIADTGPGITQEFQQKHLFHAFATTKQGGLGLGLYTCREVIKALGGDISVESQPNGGATFRVVLPCAPIRASVASRPARS